MSALTPKRIVWSIILITVLLQVVAAILIWLNWSTEVVTPVTRDYYSIPQTVGWSLLALTFTGVGTLIIVRQPHNVVGWLVAWTGLSSTVIILLDAYVLYALLTAPGSLPGAAQAAWFGILFTETLLFPELALFFVLIPGGSLLSPRWSFLIGGIGLLTILLIVAQLSPGYLAYYPLEDDVQISNPFAINGMESLFDVISTGAGTLIFPVFLVALATPILRFRRSRGIERQQLKWFLLAGMVVLVVWGLTPLLEALFGIPEPVFNVLVLPGFFSIPIAIGIAILRHNLYDIDLVINKTLVYGLATALLIASFVGSVIFFQYLLGPVTGGNDLAVAGSTLLVAALFRPVRNKVQHVVDRRFYRSKYNAQQTLRAFSVTARDAVDLDQLTGELTNVVATTMQPEHVSVWLRTSASGKK